MKTEIGHNGKTVTFFGNETMLKKTVDNYKERHKCNPKERIVGYFRHDITI